MLQKPYNIKRSVEDEHENFQNLDRVSVVEKCATVPAHHGKMVMMRRVKGHHRFVFVGVPNLHREWDRQILRVPPNLKRTVSQIAWQNFSAMTTDRSQNLLRVPRSLCNNLQCATTLPPFVSQNQKRGEQESLPKAVIEASAYVHSYLMHISGVCTLFSKMMLSVFRKMPGGVQSFLTA